MRGLMSVTGLPGQGLVRVGDPIADLCGGIFAAYGITVALLEREQSGKGQWLHTSLLEAMGARRGAAASTPRKCWPRSATIANPSFA